MEEFEDVLLAILSHFRQPYPPDIINQVFLAIEKDPVYLTRYREFADGDFHTTN